MQLQKGDIMLTALYLAFMAVMLLPSAADGAGEDNMQIVLVNKNGENYQQPNVKGNQQKAPDVKGIPVAVSIPRGDYQW